jgi:3-methyladenine DNA glycosylase AlkD
MTAKKSQYFFKTKQGQYGYGDQFIGVNSKDIRNLAKNNFNIDFSEINTLVTSKTHEDRSLGLLILVYRYKKAQTDKERTKIFKFYCRLFKSINNWDLVDISCPYIVGAYLMDRDRSLLYKWAKSKHLWTKRISIVSNWWLIRHGDLKEVFKISKILLNDEHDLIHKAVGWMLREAGKKDQKKLETFIIENYNQMPRTMLRYAIEKFPEKKRLKFLKGHF